jgi:hypothetical protein
VALHKAKNQLTPLNNINAPRTAESALNTFPGRTEQGTPNSGQKTNKVNHHGRYCIFNAHAWALPGRYRPRDLTIEPVSLDHTKQFASYGLPGKYVNDKFVPLESGDTISKVKGILVRPFPITSALDLAYIGVTANQVGDNLKRGYICATAMATRRPRKKAIRFTFAWLVAPLKARLLLCAVSDSTASNTPQLPNAEVMGPGEADGRIEIAYNI